MEERLDERESGAISELSPQALVDWHVSIAMEHAHHLREGRTDAVAKLAELRLYALNAELLRRLAEK